MLNIYIKELYQMISFDKLNKVYAFGITCQLCETTKDAGI